jgi:hypothetical protein
MLRNKKYFFDLGYLKGNDQKIQKYHKQIVLNNNFIGSISEFIIWIFSWTFFVTIQTFFFNSKHFLRNCPSFNITKFWMFYAFFIKKVGGTKLPFLRGGSVWVMSSHKDQIKK